MIAFPKYELPDFRNCVSSLGCRLAKLGSSILWALWDFWNVKGFMIVHRFLDINKVCKIVTPLRRLLAFGPLFHYLHRYFEFQTEISMCCDQWNLFLKKTCRLWWLRHCQNPSQGSLFNYGISIRNFTPRRTSIQFLPLWALESCCTSFKLNAGEWA